MTTTDHVSLMVLETTAIRIRGKHAVLSALRYFQKNTSLVLGEDAGPRLFEPLARLADLERSALLVVQHFVTIVTRYAGPSNVTRRNEIFAHADEFFTALVDNGPPIRGINLTPVGVLNELFRRMRNASPGLRVNPLVTMRERLLAADSSLAVQRRMLPILLGLADRDVIPAEIAATMLRATRVLDAAIQAGDEDHLFTRAEEFIGAFIDDRETRNRIFHAYVNLAHRYARPASLPVAFRERAEMRLELLRVSEDARLQEEFYPLLLASSGIRQPAIDAMLSVAGAIDAFTAEYPLEFRLRMYEHAHTSVIFALIADTEHARFTGLLLRMLCDS